MNATCKIGNHYFLNKFSSSFGSQFNIFVTTFNQSHSFIFFAKSDNKVLTKSVTIDKAVRTADKKTYFDNSKRLVKKNNYVCEYFDKTYR